MSAILNYFRSSNPPPSQPARRTDSFNPALAGPPRRGHPHQTPGNLIPTPTNTRLATAKDGYWKNAKRTNMWVTLATPCLTFGRTRQRLIDLDEGEAGLGDALRKEGIAACMECFGTSLFGCWGFYIARERRHIRHRLGIPGSQLRDFAGSCLCPCAAVQEHERTVFEYCIENAITTQPTPTLPMTWGDPGNRSSFITIPSSLFATPRETETRLSSQDRQSVVQSDLTGLGENKQDDYDDDDDASFHDPRIYQLCTSGHTSSDEEFLARVKAEALSIVGNAFDNTSCLDASDVENGSGSLLECSRLEYALAASASSSSSSPINNKPPQSTITFPAPAVIAPPRRTPPRASAPRASGRPLGRRAYSATFSISTIEEEDSDDTIVASAPSRNQARDTWPNHNKLTSGAATSSTHYAEAPSLRRKPRFTENDIELQTAEAVPIRNLQAVVRDNTSTHIARCISVFREPELLVQQIEVRQRGRQVQPLQPQRSFRDALWNPTDINTPSYLSSRSGAHSPLSCERELAARRDFFETMRNNSSGQISRGEFPERRESWASNYSIGTKARLQAIRRRWHRRHIRAMSEPRYMFDSLQDGSSARTSESSTAGPRRERQRETSTSQRLPGDSSNRRSDRGAFDGTGSIAESFAGASVAPNDESADADVEDCADSCSSLVDRLRTSESSLASQGTGSQTGIGTAIGTGHGRSMSVPEMGGLHGVEDVEYLREMREAGFLRR